MKIRALFAAGGAAAVLAFVTTVEAQQPRPVDAAVLKAAGTANDPMEGSWLSYGRTQGETRYSPLKQINASNAGKLGLSWSIPIGAGGGNQEGTPLVWNNTIYGITNWSVVFAVDARTGKQLWRWDPEVNQQAVRPKLCCGIVNRGMAISNGLIFAPVIDGRLIALDALNGQVKWEARLGYPQDWVSITMAPRVAGNKVVIGIAGGDHPVRGFVDAYDIATGHRAWRFYTVPGDPSKGFEDDSQREAAKTWGGEYWKGGGGGAVWDGLSYDPDLNMVYVGTGNAEPWVQKFRGATGKDNLYSCSILALDVNTGKLKWHYQVTPNDNWDYDAVQQLMLVDLNIKGRTRKVLMQAPKNGFFYVLDRATGELISAEPFAQVSWAKGIDMKTGRPIMTPEAFYDKTPVTLVPTAGGAHNWAPMSWNPATGLVYIPTTYGNWTFVAGDVVLPLPTGHTGLGTVTGTPIVPPAIGPAPMEGQRGVLQAWDPVNQKLVWRTAGGGGIGGGTLSTAGNLVFQVIIDGRFLVYTADKGEKLLEIQTNRSGMTPPITYMVDGKQYIAFMGGAGRAPNVVGPTDAKVDTNTPTLFVFEVGGTAALPVPSAAAPPVPAPKPVAPKPSAPAAEAPHN
ncbi:MAG: PQQ-dependent dehydrogenase, methanol/ethanol family [Acidobacteriota bacterium]